MRDSGHRLTFGQFRILFPIAALALIGSPSSFGGQLPLKAGDRVVLQLVPGAQTLPGTVKEARPHGVYIVNLDFRLPVESRSEISTAGNPGKLFVLHPDGQKGADVASLGETGRSEEPVTDPNSREQTRESNSGTHLMKVENKQPGRKYRVGQRGEYVSGGKWYKAIVIAIASGQEVGSYHV